MDSDQRTALDHSWVNEKDGSDHSTAVFSKPIWPVASSGTASGDGASRTYPVACSAAVMSRTPAPVVNGSPSAGFRAESMSLALTVPGFSAGSCSSISAAAAETMGADMLVPDISKYSSTCGKAGSPATRPEPLSRSEPAARVETILFPGASRSGLTAWSMDVGPREEYVVMMSSAMSGVLRSLVAPTVMTLRELQGLVIVP